MRTFGNSLSSIRGAFYFAGVFWLFLFIVFTWLDRIHVDLLSRLTSSFIYSLGIASIPLIAIVPTCAFSLRIDANSVCHVFLGRFVISLRSLDDLRAVEIATGWGAVLKFDQQRPIRFLGASLPELRSLCLHLSELRPDQISFSAGLAAAGLLALEDRIRGPSEDA